MTLPDSTANRDLLGYLRARAQPGTGMRHADLDGWELHTHPGLIERLGEIAGSPKAVVPLYGVVAIVVKDTAAAMAEGTDTLLLRLPEPPRGVEPGTQIEPLCSNGWYAVSPWQSELPSAVGMAKLTTLMQVAREHTNRIASART